MVECDLAKVKVEGSSPFFHLYNSCIRIIVDMEV